MKHKNRVLLKDIKKGSRYTGLAILNALATCVELAGELAISRRNAYRVINDCCALGTGWSDIKVSKRLYDLKRRGYLTFEGKGGQTSVKFTNKAKIKTLETLAEKIEADGKNRFISFDIPESYKAKRDQFRQALKDPNPKTSPTVILTPIVIGGRI